MFLVWHFVAAGFISSLLETIVQHGPAAILNNPQPSASAGACLFVLCMCDYLYLCV